MSGKSGPLFLIAAGTLALYLAYTGRLQGAWDGITGKFDRPPTTPGTSTGTSAGSDTGGGYTNPNGDQTPADTIGGGGQGGPPNGVFYVTTSGEMMTTRAGV